MQESLGFSSLPEQDCASHLKQGFAFLVMGFGVAVWQACFPLALPVRAGGGGRDGEGLLIKGSGWPL